MLAGEVAGDVADNREDPKLMSSTDEVVVSAFGLCWGVTPPPATGLRVVVSGGLADAELAVPAEAMVVVGEPTTCWK